MLIKEFDPSPALEPYIKSFILIEDTGGLLRNKWMSVYPSGHLEMIFSYGDRTVLSKDGFVLQEATGFLGGQTAEPYRYMCEGRLKVISIILKPWGIFKILNMPQYEFTNYIIDLKFIFGNESHEILDKLCETSIHKSKIDLIEDYLIHFLKNSTNDYCPLVTAASMIANSNGGISVKEVSKALNTSIKTVERNFKKMIGISPKTFSRIIRFNNTLNDLNSNTQTPIQDLVHRYGYYDQSHLINDFKKFTSHTPTEHINRDSNVIYSFRELIQI